jgi:hypothetical protein
MPVSRLYFGVTNLGLSLRPIAGYRFNPPPIKILYKSPKIVFVFYIALILIT